MPATTTRKEALERISKTFHDALERMIPADEDQRLPGNTFRDFELEAQKFKAAVIPTLLKERARLTDSAQMKEGGKLSALRIAAGAFVWLPHSE